jgi:hypothetical protein
MIGMRAEQRGWSIGELRDYVDEINLLSLKEFRTLFPTELYIERLIFAKSFTAHWLPDASSTTMQ